MKEMLRKAEADLQQKRQAALQEKAAQAEVKKCAHYATYTTLSPSYRPLHCAFCLIDSGLIHQPLRQSPFPSPLLVSAVFQQPLRVWICALQASAQSADEPGEEASSQQESVTKTE